TGLGEVVVPVKLSIRVAQDSPRGEHRSSLGQADEYTPPIHGERRWKCELLELRSSELISPLPEFIGNTFTVTTCALLITDLLEPEARGARVENGEQAEVIVLGRIGRQLDHRRRLLEHLAPAVEHKM